MLKTRLASFVVTFTIPLCVFAGKYTEVIPPHGSDDKVSYPDGTTYFPDDDTNYVVKGNTVVDCMSDPNTCTEMLQEASKSGDPKVTPKGNNDGDKDDAKKLKKPKTEKKKKSDK